MFSSHCHLRLKRHVLAGQKKIPIYPFKHHFAPVVHAAFADKLKGSDARERKFAWKRFCFVVKIKQEGFVITGNNKAG